MHQCTEVSPGNSQLDGLDPQNERREPRKEPNPLPITVLVAYNYLYQHPLLPLQPWHHSHPAQPSFPLLPLGRTAFILPSKPHSSLIATPTLPQFPYPIHHCIALLGRVTGPIKYSCWRRRASRGGQRAGVGEIEGRGRRRPFVDGEGAVFHVGEGGEVEEEIPVRQRITAPRSAPSQLRRREREERKKRTKAAPKAERTTVESRNRGWDRSRGNGGAGEGIERGFRFGCRERWGGG